MGIKYVLLPLKVTYFLFCLLKSQEKYWAFAVIYEMKNITTIFPELMQFGKRDYLSEFVR